MPLTGPLTNNNIVENEIKRKLSMPLHHEFSMKSPAFIPNATNLKSITSLNLDNPLY